MRERNTMRAMTRRAPRALALSVAIATLCACGGGGGNTRTDPPPLAPPPPPPPTTPPPTVVNPPHPAYSGHIVQTNADVAHALGFTGEGLRIGFVDSGVNRDHPSLAGRVSANLVYIDPRENNLQVDDVVGHGTAVAQAAAGSAFGQWPGGIAPGAGIVSARIISDEPPEDDGSGEGNEVDGPLGLAPIHRDLIARGVRIMNNSWGGLYWTNPDATAAIAEEYRSFIVDNDGLVVFASGNSSDVDPSDMAALPVIEGPGGSLPAAYLERGWITVSALATGSPDVLADYSNACGIAMDFCMVAPGTVTVTGTGNAPNAPDYWNWSGTSLAAPLVSGAAALVWEAFPYFDNDLVRQTLLGTATDLGAPGVDAVFGHGRLDVGKAVLGPSRLDWGMVTADFDDITSRWDNVIDGAGGIVKRGTGRLELGKPLRYDGGTVVEGGTLAPSYSLPGDTSVGAGGTLELFNASVGGDLDNAGRVEITGGAGHDIAGDYRHGDDATLAMHVGSHLFVEGGVTLEGGALEITGLVQGYVRRDTERMIATWGGVTGQFDALTRGPGVFLEASLVYGADFVDLEITRLDVTAAALSFSSISPAGLSAAQRVEGAFRQIDGQERGDASVDVPIPAGFIAVAGDIQRIGSEALAEAALSSLSGEAHAASATMTFDAVDMGRRALSSRFGDLAMQGQAGQWRQALGEGGHGGYAGNGFASDGWLAGQDQRLANGAVAGFAVGETRAWGTGAGNDRSEDRQLHGQAYVGAVSGNGYVFGQASVGRFDRDIERALFTGQARNMVASRYSGDVLGASLEAGWQLPLGATALTPYVGVDYTRLASDGFAELGADGFGLRTRDWTASRSQAIAGLRVSREWAGIALQGYGEWQQTLSADGLEVDASFVGVDAWSPLPSLSPARSGGLFGIGAETRLGRDALLRLGYDQRLGSRGDARMVSLRYALGF
jgi:autotransporter-associated beta strand protein